jgi:hypothetical protein
MWKKNKIGRVGTELEEERKQKKKKEMAIGVKPIMSLLHMSSHHRGSAKTFQISSWKAIFDDWTTPHASPKKHQSCHELACFFFYNILYKVIYNNSL